MAVGNTINYSIPVVGTTVSSLTRVQGNTFLKDAYSIGGSSFPATLLLRPAGAQAIRRRFGVTFAVRPDATDAPGSFTQGSLSISLNVDSRFGSIVDDGDRATAIRHFLSTLLHSNLIEDLGTGVAL
jgi:hypothetical protein